MANPTVTAIVTAEDRGASATLKAIAALAAQVAKELDKGNKSNLARQFSAADIAARAHVSTLGRMKVALAEIGASIKAAGAAYAAWKLPELTKEALAAGAQLQHAEIGLKVAGIPEEELVKLRSSISDAQIRLPGITTEASLELAKELRSILLHVSEVPEMLPVAMRAKASIDSADPTGASSGGLGFLFKGAELLGYAQNPEKFERYINAGVKAMQVMGRLINPEQIFEIAKFEKASGVKLSERFQFTTALSLAQELGGSTVGQSLDQFQKTVQGAVQNHQALKEALALGLVNAGDVLYTKTNEAKGLKPGKTWSNVDKAMTDPDKYIWENVVPALRAKGFDTEDKMIPELRKLFPAGRAADFAIKTITQQASFENHAKLYDVAQGLGAADTYLKDASAALKTLGNVAHDFASVVTEPMMEGAAKGLSDFALSLAKLKNSYVDWAKAHPKEAPIAAAAVPAAGLTATALAAWGGFAGLKKLLGGAALDGSAVALTGSAAALTEAAALLGGKGLVGGRVIQGAGAASGAMASAAAGAGATAGAGVGAAIKGAIKGGLAAAAMGVLWEQRYNVEEKLTGRDAKLSRDLVEAVNARLHPTHSGPSFKDVFERLRVKIPEAPPLPVFVRSPATAFAEDHGRTRPFVESSLPQGMKYFGHDAGPQKVDVSTTVSGEVHGEATLMNRIVVEPSPLLTAIVHEAQQAKISLQGAINDLGRSMPSSSGVTPRRAASPLGLGSGGFGFGVAGTK